MKSISSILAALALTSALALAVDEKPATPAKEGSQATTKPDATTTTPAAEGAKPKADPEAAFKKLDKDSDGFVSLEEFKASPRGKKDPAKAEEFFKKKDKDNDGKLSLEEFKSTGGAKKNK